MVILSGPVIRLEISSSLFPRTLSGAGDLFYSTSYSFMVPGFFSQEDSHAIPDCPGMLLARGSRTPLVIASSLLATDRGFVAPSSWSAYASPGWIA